MQRQAVAKTITKESIAAERAKEAHGLSLKIQVARTLIAVAFTVGGLRTIQTGVWPLPPVWAARAPPPSVLALYAPAVVGAFELTAGIGDLCYIHKYQLDRLALQRCGLRGPALRLDTGPRRFISFRIAECGVGRSQNRPQDLSQKAEEEEDPAAF